MNRRLIFVLAIAIGLAKSLVAQTPDSISLDVSVGPSVGSGAKNYYQQGTAAGEFTMAFGAVHTTGRVIAFAIGGNIAYSSTDACALDEEHLGQCRPIFPSTTHLGLLGGYHVGTPHTALRAMIGPVVFGGGGASGGGGQIQLDGTAGLTNVAFLVGVRGQVLRRTNGETLYIRSLGFGVRLQ